jgi:simple sugar transport system substrate-binding protein
MKKIIFALLVIGLSVFALFACSKKDDTSKNINKTATINNTTHINAEDGTAFSICVFVPGFVSGSPTYEMLVKGVTRAADDFKINHKDKTVAVSVIEGGYNQAEWEGKITSIAAAEKYDVIISSNPSIPDIVKVVNQKFASQKFILFDGALSGVNNVYTLSYNTKEEAYMAGFYAALYTQDIDNHATSVGLLAAQEYPVMNDIILPFFEKGAQAVNKNFKADFRVLGNWFDAEKASSLASSMYRDGCKIILTIAGGANEGVLEAAARTKNKVLWFDSDGGSIRDDIVVGSAIVAGEEAAYDKTYEYLTGILQFGTTSVIGVAEHYVDFITAAGEPNSRKIAMLALKERILRKEIIF